MNSKKNRLAYFLTPLLLCALTACGSDPAEEENSELVICAPGTTYNPISGECISENNATTNNTNVNNTAANNTAANNASVNNTTANNTTANNSTPNNTASPNNTTTNNNTNNNVVLPMGPVDPGCVDGQYSETLPVMGDFSQAEANYSPASIETFVLAALQARYEVGHDVVSGAVDSGAFPCIDQFISDSSSAAGVVRAMSTVVHECGHSYDIGQAGFGDDHFFLTSQTSFTCSQGDTTSRGGKTFARSRMNNDMFGPSRPKCNGSNMPGCDFYADVYLDGDPDDANFDGGDQGFNSVLEETTQYVNSLATGYAFRDRYSSQISERDGLLTFLWYIGRYLHMARTQYPDAHAFILGSPCYREAILSVWGRAWIYLDATENERNLGIDDDAIMALVMDDVILSEIQRVREAHGCGM